MVQPLCFLGNLCLIQDKIFSYVSMFSWFLCQSFHQYHIILIPARKNTTDGGYKTYRVKYMTIIALRMGSWDKKNYTFTKFSHGDMFEGRLS